MSNYKDLAIRYGGFTSLDLVYLDQTIGHLSENEQLRHITPPPSVINAYFAELYQKKSPEAATSYFFELSQKLHLFNDKPSFIEKKPFVRLNLSGQSFGYCYEDDTERAIVFSEKDRQVTADLLFEIAQIFPHYLVFECQGKITMIPASDEEIVERQSVSPLSDLLLLADGRKKLVGYSQEEIIELSQSYLGGKAYRSQNRTAMIYID